MTESFKKAYAITMKHEGGYVNDPDDRGGETYSGISRRWHPGWEGWRIIEGCKADPEFPSCLAKIKSLQEQVELFYFRNFWAKNNCEQMPEIIAKEVFDNAINMGPDDSGKFLQHALNALNRNQKIYSDLKVDSWIGTKTLKALDVLVERNEVELLYKVINILQGAHYIEQMNKFPEQEKYVGWFKRVEFIKHPG